MPPPMATEHSPPPPYSRTSPAPTSNGFSASLAAKPGLRSRTARPKTDEVLERERIVLSHLPPVETRPTPIRSFVKTQVFKLVYFVIATLFGLYLRARWAYHNVVNRGFSVLYYHHRTPQLIQKDVREMKERGKFPRHVSVVLEYERNGLDSLIDDVAEIACWCASAGIPRLSVYERKGILKSYITTSHRAVAQRLRSYFGRVRPSVRVYAPHAAPYANSNNNDLDPAADSRAVDLEVIFISEEDGRESLVDLTKTLCDMAQRGKIAPEDVSVELVDAEVRGLFGPSQYTGGGGSGGRSEEGAGVGGGGADAAEAEEDDYVLENVMDDPELLILFSPTVNLRGYPPWPLRLTEIYHVTDNSGVGYQVFLRALHGYAETEFRFGR